MKNKKAKEKNEIECEKNKTTKKSKLVAFFTQPIYPAINKKNEIKILFLSLAISFTVFFFSPIDIFLGNQREFVVSFGHAAVPMFLTSLVSTAVFFIVLNAFLYIHEVVFQFVSSALFGIFIALYVQTLFLNSKMAAITGDDADYIGGNSAAVKNLVILICIAAVPLILTIISWFAKKNKFLCIFKEKIMPYVCGLIFVMQLVGTGSSILTTDFSKYDKLYTTYLSYEPTTKLSKDGNVVVFLCDRLDSLWMDTTLEEYPELNEKFEGFTFYQNNISHNTNTFPSIPQMLTHSQYGGNDWADYISSAWEGETVEKKLKENGYHVNLLIDNLTTYGSVGQLEGQCDNFGSCEKSNVKFNYLGSGGIVPTMTRLSLAKLSPYMWKNDLVNGLGANLSADFITYDNVDSEDMLSMAVGVKSDLKYFDYIKNHEFTADSAEKTFTFVHLNGAHDAEEELSALYDSDAEVDRWSTIRGDFEILFYYFEQMKKLGIYDNSTIIVLGDHGRAPAEIEVDDMEGLESAITTALLVKPANAENKDLKLDRYSELSLDFFPASVLEYAGIDHKDFGLSFNDVIDGKLHPDRWMQTFDFHGYGKVDYKAYYKVTGDARDFSNWEEQPEHE